MERLVNATTPASQTPQGPEQLLLQLFRQAAGNPNPGDFLDVPVDLFPQGSQARHLLEGFADMLARMKEKEEALRHSQQSYEQLVNTIDGIVWEADAQTFEFRFVSKQAERLLGYPTERWLTEPTFWPDHMHPDDRPWAPTYCSIATKEKRNHDLQYRMIAADGRIVWLRDIVTVVIEDNTPALLRGVMIDITEQKEAEDRLREMEEQYRAIFEATSDGLVINDMDGIVVEVNQAFCEMHRYSRHEFIGSDLTRLHPPGSQPVYWEYLDTVKDGRVFMTQVEHIHQRKDGTLFNVEVVGSQFNLGGKPHILGVVRDVTERVRAYELLEERVEERTRELSTLLEVSKNITSTLDLKPLMMRILDQIKVVTGYDSSSISVLEGNKLSFLELRGPTREKMGIEWSIPVGKLGAIWEELLRGAPVIIPDVHGDTPMARAFRDAAGTDFEVEFGHIHSWLGAPLLSKERVIGMLALSHAEPDRYGLHDAGLVTAIANQAAVSIENARLYEQAQTTGRITGALSETASRVAYGGSLDGTLNDICRQVVEATSAVASAVLLFGPETRDFGPETRDAYIAGAHGLPEDFVAVVNRTLAAGAVMESIQALLRREVTVVPRLDPRLYQLVAEYPDYRIVRDFVLTEPFDYFVSVPMIYGDDLVGGLIVYYPRGSQMDEALLAFQAAIADQTAVAVQNTRLLTQVQEKAALEQRHHLARELHDSVTQSLFSINLISRSIEVMADRDGSQSVELTKKIGSLRQLTQGALAEMRALIFELRPGALEEEGLAQAIRKHAAAIQSRDMLRIDVVAEDQKIPRLNPDVEEALYRITQEALHNIVKHARASNVEITLRPDGDLLLLQVTDDGVGFDVEKVPAGHMGLGTMGQRAAALNAAYEVTSAPGMGTTVSVRLLIT